MQLQLFESWLLDEIGEGFARGFLLADLLQLLLVHQLDLLGDHLGYHILHVLRGHFFVLYFPLSHSVLKIVTKIILLELVYFGFQDRLKILLHLSVDEFVGRAHDLPARGFVTVAPRLLPTEVELFFEFGVDGHAMRRLQSQEVLHLLTQVEDVLA